MKYSSILYSTSAALAIVIAQPAVVKQAAAQAQAAAADSGALQEVVVTARKRSEDLQKTPVSVSVVSGAQAAEMNVQQFQDLRGLVPNLEVLPVASGNAVNLTVRGIGQGSVQVNVDTKVGFYLDDMYIARADGNQLHFYDIDNTQVLKGPQGTLFGKNTTAGALLLSSKRPAFDNSGYIRLRAGNFNRLDTEGAVNVPITENVLTRFSWRTQSADGYIKHLLDNATSADTNDKSGRLQVRLLPNDDLTIDLSGEYNQADTAGGESIMTGCNPNATYQKFFTEVNGVSQCTLYPPLNNPYLIYGGSVSSIPTSSLYGLPGPGGVPVKGGDYGNGAGLTPNGHRNPFSSQRIGTINLRWVYDIDENLSLKSITGFRRSLSNWYQATLNAPRDIYSETDHTTTEQVSQEVNLNGKMMDDRLNFVIGLYYIYQNTGFDQNTGPDWIDPTGYEYAARNQFLSYAVYAQGDYKITPELQLTLGARYNVDNKQAVSDVWLQTNFSTAPCAAGGGHTYFYNAFVAGAAACNGHLTGAGNHNWYDFDPRAQLQYQFTDDFMAYVSATGGYNAGGFNQQLGANLGGGLVPYSRERIWSYETGFKTQWLDRRLRLNISGFYQTFDNIQTTITVTYNGVTTRAVQNGATAHQDGIEAEVEAIPTPDLTLRANFAYLDQAYDEIAKGVTAFTLTTPVTTAARYTFSMAGNYTFHMPSDATVVAALNWRWVGSKPSCNPIGTCYTPSYGLLGGRLDYNSPDRDWSVGLWSSNLLDKVYYTSYTAGPNTNMGITSYVTGRPREFGIELRRNF